MLFWSSFTLMHVFLIIVGVKYRQYYALEQNVWMFPARRVIIIQSRYIRPTNAKTRTKRKFEHFRLCFNMRWQSNFMNNLIRASEDSIDYDFWSYFLFPVWDISSLASYLKCKIVYTVTVYNPEKASALKLFVIVFRDLHMWYFMTRHCNMFAWST